MVSSDVTVAQDGGHVKLHPYLVALVRWCVSCVWSTATLLLQRLMTTPLPQITARKPSTKPREASTGHLHPEPKVECEVLRTPDVHKLDVIFVHGLYGSLSNTWRQGDWRSKYNIAPHRIPLRRPSSIPNPCTCNECEENTPTETATEDIYKINNENNTRFTEYKDFNDINLNNIDEDFYTDIKQLIPNDNVFVSESFYENKFINQVEVVDNYETHAEFVRDLFKLDDNCDLENGCAYNELENNTNVYENKCDFSSNLNFNCRLSKEEGFEGDKDLTNRNKDSWQYRIQQDEITDKQTEHNECKPNTNISINNTETKAINCLCKTKKQDSDDKLLNGVDKSIENDASEKEITEKLAKSVKLNLKSNNAEVRSQQSEISSEKYVEGSIRKDSNACEVGCGCVCEDCYSECWPRDWIGVDYPDARVISINYTSDPYLWRPLWVKESKRLRLHERAEQMTEQLLAMGVGQKPIIWVGHSKGGLFIKQIYCEAYEAHLKVNKIEESSKNSDDNCAEDKLKKDPKEKEQEFDEINVIRQENNSNNEEKYRSERDLEIGEEIRIGEDLNTVGNDNKVINEDHKKREDKTFCDDDPNVNNDLLESLTDTEDSSLVPRVGLWRNSVGFMFYSVPHLGSPLADIKTPLTARSIELLEISKDSAPVVALQARWLAACRARAPVVRSLVETARTLMAVLWLRIVSVDSADPGIGALCGVSVDHREICKPTSRHCLLYTELTNLMRAALNKCKCQ